MANEMKQSMGFGKIKKSSLVIILRAQITPLAPTMAKEYKAHFN
jgi:hypothetical protein